jgi:hypothetical protein
MHIYGELPQGDYFEKETGIRLNRLWRNFIRAYVSGSMHGGNSSGNN